MDTSLRNGLEVDASALIMIPAALAAGFGELAMPYMTAKFSFAALIKWHVAFEKCIPFLRKTLGCATCIASCQLSSPERATRLTVKWALLKAGLATN